MTTGVRTAAIYIYCWCLVCANSSACLIHYKPVAFYPAKEATGRAVYRKGNRCMSRMSRPVSLVLIWSNTQVLTQSSQSTLSLNAVLSLG